jgi:hypothetical protein
MSRPSVTVRPAAFSVEAAEKWALERSRNMPDRPFRLKALWSINRVLQPTPTERKTRYVGAVAHTDTYGSCVTLAPLPEPDPDLVGEDARRILNDRRCRDHVYRTAIVDAVIGSVSRPADDRIDLGDAPDAKYAARSEVFAEEAQRILDRAEGRASRREPPRVLVVGATAGMLGALVRRGFTVSATDMASDVVGRELGGVTVQDARHANATLMEDADLAIITGMALTNGTLEGLMSLARTRDTSTMIWAITGRNFGHYYTEHGVDSAISDPSPFLQLPGPSVIEIWRRRG